MSSFSFDLTQKNILGLLLVGGSVHLRPNSYYDAQEIADTIGLKEISIINCTPSAFYPLLEETDPITQLLSLKQVFSGGEPINMGRLRPDY